MLSFHLGPLAIPVSLAIVAAAWLAAHGAGLLAGRGRRVSVAADLNDMLLWGFVAARVGFVLSWFSLYAHRPLAMLDLRDGGFLPWAGIAAALLLAVWRGWRGPERRRPLAVAVLIGALAWAGGEALQQGHAKAALSTRALPQLDGAPASLPALAAGKPVVLNLWASWCPPCLREMPLLQDAQRQRSDVSFIFANQGEDEVAVREFFHKQPLRLKHVLLDPGGALGREYGSAALPTTLFFDADGRLASVHLGELSAATLASKLQTLTRSDSKE
ncbi:thiol-disulfide isomerase/thioredoxin [Chromobacterium alkanivorans]|uniref:TlpA family protein disulfide reductase n=1 Tax=Chromobacterium alkanivorans TaxID=1071719 RepID=UPI002168C5B2|nr:TlpA disulfide reductase family protein [Chromobacterium alkanivorans]MCS3805737.1 thiol-disulfide isomerase/thioredoxin [Chromobacterium alkanivorans]MCS3820033.1 thiol-disulfide isomerase/thioredoxin [Chromobacterium alkanivorans]MCS3874790.1 thiol-disulfide isomerase/thioredoxin [Chromobacterium alkanivorans]